MGREHALLLGRLGATVIINDLLPEPAEAVAAAIGAAGGTAVAVPGSIAEAAVVEAVVAAAVERWGRVDAVVHNAGVDVAGSLEGFDDADLARLLDVHVWGAWRLARRVWPHMRRAGRGRVLLVGSAGVYGMAGNAAYVAAKGALLGLSRALAVEGAPLGIRVNCLGPLACTPMAREMVRGQDDLIAWMERYLPPDTTSPVAAWLVHPDCEATGEFITAYGRHFGRMFMSETRGANYSTGGGADGGDGEDYTVERVRDRFAQACDMKDSVVVISLPNVMEKLVTPNLHANS